LKIYISEAVKKTTPPLRRSFYILPPLVACVGGENPSLSSRYITRSKEKTARNLLFKIVREINWLDLFSSPTMYVKAVIIYIYVSSFLLHHVAFLGTGLSKTSCNSGFLEGAVF
jgi:hypothetical protein